MSIKVMNLVWSSTLDGSSRRFILLALADRANDAGYCWPGIANLAAKTGMSRSTVFRLLADLENEDSLIQRAKRPTVGQRMGNAYRINIALLREMQRPAEDEDDEMAALFADTPADGSQSGTGPNLGPIPDRDGKVPDSDLTRPKLGPDTSGDTPPTSKTLSPRKRDDEAGQVALIAPVTKPRKRATRIPDDFTVTPDMVAWARERVPHVDGRHETEKFINHWKAESGSRATKLDWPATWRKWMLIASERNSGTRRSFQNQNQTDANIAAFLGTGTDGPALYALTGGER